MEFVRESGSNSRSLWRWEDMRLPGHKDPRNCVDPRNLGKSEWGQKLGKTRWDENEMMSIYPGVSRIYTPRRSFHLRYPCISIHPPSFLNDVLGGRDQASSEMHLEARIEWTQRYTPRPWASEFGDAHWGRDPASLEMQLETDIEWTQRCTWRPWSSEFGDALRGRDRVNSEMHLEAVIEQVWRCTGRPWSSECGDAHWGRDRGSLEMQLETEIEWTQTHTARPWSSEFGNALVAGYDWGRLEEYLEAVDLEGGATAAETLFIG